MSLETEIVGFDDENSDDPDQYLKVPRKKSARRSLESQFETCVQDEGFENADGASSAANSSAHSSSSNAEKPVDEADAPIKCLAISEIHLKPPQPAQIYAASSTESIASSASSRRRARSPTRTPSFCAAVSSSLLSIDQEVKREVERSETKLSALKSKSKTSSTKKSITSLPQSPHVPNQTSTPAPYNPMLNISSSHVNNTIDSDTALCRICHDGDSLEGLVSPCYCTGTVGALHMTCLEHWLGASNTTRCEICKYEFKVERKPRSFTEFLRHPTSQSDRKNMVCDLVCFIVLTPLTVCSAFLCLMGVKHYDQWSGRWEVIGLASLTACLLSIFVIWCSVAIKHHLDVYRDWRQKNQVIKIIYLSPTKGRTVLRTQTVTDTNNNNSVAHTPRPSLGCRIQVTPSSLHPLCRSTLSQARGNRSYSTAMLKPILKYSVNLQTYSNPSELESLSHTFNWTAADSSDCGSYPLLCTAHAQIGKETCV